MSFISNCFGRVSKYVSILLTVNLVHGFLVFIYAKTFFVLEKKVFF